MRLPVLPRTPWNGHQIWCRGHLYRVEGYFCTLGGAITEADYWNTEFVLESLTPLEPGQPILHHPDQWGVLGDEWLNTQLLTDGECLEIESAAWAVECPEDRLLVWSWQEQHHV